MKQPPRFEDPHQPQLVCKLAKALYGLKQAPRAQHSRLSAKLCELGFILSRTDTSLFIYNHDGVTVYMLVYGDDIIITGSSDQVVNQLLQKLQVDFAMKDLGELHYFLGIEVKKTSTGIVLTQSKYTSELLKKMNMEKCKPVAALMTVTEKLSRTEGELLSLEDAIRYRSIVGALQYSNQA